MNIENELQIEVKEARRQIKADSYSMSIGEIIRKIEENEIILNPKFQRYFRWSNKQQSDLVESIFIDIPLPPIFIFTRDDGKWEIIDGLQRLTTISNFSKNKFILYKDPNEEATYIKKLKGKKYQDLSNTLQLIFKNKRIDIVLLLGESSTQAKYDMFNRLNTGGSQLSRQEIRNCIMIMMNEKFFDWLEKLNEKEIFKKTVINNLSDTREKERADLDLLLRFLSFRNINGDIKKINAIKSVNEFLDKNALEMCEDKNYDFSSAEKDFNNIFSLIIDVFGDDAFKRYSPNENKFINGFNYSSYEFLVSGIAYYINYWNEKTIQNVKNNLLQDYKQLCKENEEFKKYSKGGVPVETRFKKLITLSKKFFAKYE